MKIDKSVFTPEELAQYEALIAKVTELGEELLRAAYQQRNKQVRTQACREAFAKV